MEKTSKLNPQALLALVAMAFVVAAIWAATALAGGGSSSSSSDSTGGSQPAAEFAQSEEDGTAPAAGDCPEGDSGSGGDSQSDSNESSSTDF